MKDIDFDELDKAVNRFLNEDGSSAASKTETNQPKEAKNIKPSTQDNPKKAPRTNIEQPDTDIDRPKISAVASPVQPARSRSAGELHRSAPATPARRSGRFMDIMVAPPQARKAPARPIVPEITPVATEIIEPTAPKHSADLQESLGTTRRRFRKSPKTELNDQLESVSDVKYEEPVLEEVTSTKIPEPSAVVPGFDDLKAVQVVPGEDIPTDDLRVVEGLEDVDVQEEKFVEPILQDVELEKTTLNDEIVTFGKPGVMQIDDGEDLSIYGHPSETVRERVNRQSIEEARKTVDLDDNSVVENTTNNDKPPIEVEKTSKTAPNSPKTSETVAVSSVNAPEDEPLTTPFLPNARVDKRPLGAAPIGGVKTIESTESRLVNSSVRSKKSKKSRSLEPPVPLLSSDEYSGPITPRNRRKSGWPIVFAILSIIAVGALGGLLAWYLLLG